MSGHYRMHRGWMDNPALGGDREPFCRRAAWAWLIENAQWKAAKIDVGGATVTIERGQLCHSYRHLAKAWNWSVGKVQLFIDRLKTDTMINTATNTGRLVITICNYERYQAPIETTNTPSNTVANTPPIRGQYDTKEGKKESYKNGGDHSVSVDANPARAHTHETPARSAEIIPLRPDAQPMPANWVMPDAWRAAAADAGLSTPELSALKFRDHWRDKGVVKDEAGWWSAWEWWFRKDIEWERKHGQHHNTGRRTKHGNGLVAYAHAEMQRDPGFAEDHQDDGRWRELRD